MEEIPTVGSPEEAVLPAACEEDTGEGVGAEGAEDDVVRARYGHSLCLHLLFDFAFVQLEHSLQGGARQAGHVEHAFRGGFLFCFCLPGWRGFIVRLWNISIFMLMKQIFSDESWF